MAERTVLVPAGSTGRTSLGSGRTVLVPVAGRSPLTGVAQRGSLPAALGIGLSASERDRLAARIAAGAPLGSAPGGGFLGALARDFADVVTSIPASAVFAGRVGSTFLAGPLIAGSALVNRTPLRNPVTTGLTGYGRGTADQVIDAGRAIAADYAYRYSPLFQGNFGEAGSRFMAHPLAYLLDAGAVYSLGAKGATSAAKGAGFGPTGSRTVAPGTGNRLERILSYIGDTAADGRRRARNDRQVFVPVEASTELLAPTLRARRPGSTNPLTNAVQRAIDRRVDARDVAFAGASRFGIPETVGGFTVPGSATAAYNRANRYIGQTVRMEGTDRARRDFTETSRAYQKLIRRMGPIRNRLKGTGPMEEALFLHVSGLLDYKRLGFGTPQEALDGAIAYWEQGIREAAGTKTRTKASEKALEKMRELREHPELLDLDAAPPVLVQAIAEAKRIIREGQSRIESGQDFVSPATGLITREQIEAARTRAAEQAFGGSRYSDVLVDREKVVDVPGYGTTTLERLEAERKALIAQAQMIRSPAARKEALAEARMVERQINEGIQEFWRGNREEGLAMIRAARQRLDELAESSRAQLPGGGSRLGPASFPEFRQVDATERVRARANELEAAAAAIDERVRPLIEFFSRRSSDRGARNEFLSGDQELDRALEDLARQRGAAGMSLGRVMTADDLYPLITEHVRPSAPVKWKAGRGKPGGISKEASALIDEYERLSAIRSRIAERAKVGKSGEVDGYDSVSIEAAMREAAQRVHDKLQAEADARNAARGADLPGRMAALKEKVGRGRLGEESLGKIAAEIAALHGQRPLDIWRLVVAARRELEAAVTSPREFAKLERWVAVLEDAFRRAVAERVALIPEGPERDAALRIIADESNPLALPDGPLPLRNPQEVLAALDEASGLRAEAEMIRRAVEAREGMAGVELEAPEVVRSLEDVYIALAEKVGVEKKMVSSRRRRDRNASEATGPAPEARVPAGQARGSRRQAERMFGKGSVVPRSRQVAPDRDRPLTPVEAAVESIGLGEVKGLVALERLIPAEMAREHRLAIAEVYESLGAVRASFGGTPADMADTLAELRKVREAMRKVRKKVTGGWTTPRPIDAMHAQIPHTPEMTEAQFAITRQRAALADIEERLREIQAIGGDNPELADEARGLQRQRARYQGQIDRAEVAFHELETHEAIKLWGEFGDPDGSYWAMRPRRRQSPKAERDDRGGRPRPQNRLSAERIYRNRGTLFRTFNFSTGRRDPLNMLMRGVRAEHSALALRELVERAGVRWAADRFDEKGILIGQNGDLVRGESVTTMLRQSPDTFRAVHMPSLQKVLEQLREQEIDGQFDRGSALEAVFLKDTDIDNIERALVAGEWNADDVALLPKAAADEYVDASHGIFRGYDNALGLWKAGVLVFTPRWYILNAIGNTLQYGLLSGGDVRSVLLAGLGKFVAPTAKLRARYRELGERYAEITPEEVASVSQASEIGVAEGVSHLGGISDRLFEFNQRLEGVIRRAAYINAAKREVKRGGDRKRTRSADELADAIDELSDIERQAALEQALLFLGDYRRFNRFERGFVRRVVPFYSWLRVISRLTLGLPFRSPLRAQVLSLMATVVQEEWDPLEEALELGRPLFARGGIELPEQIPVVGGLTLRTNSLNPFNTAAELYVEPLAALGRGGISEGLGAAVQAIAPSLAPGTTAAIEAATPGFQVFGNRAVSAPPGYGGLIQAFGGSYLKPSASGGYKRTSGPQVPFIENLLQSFLPYYGSAARQFAAAGQKTYDTATLPSIVAARLGIEARVPGVFDSRRGQVFRAPNPKFPPITEGEFPLTPIASLFGFPVERRDELAEAQQRLRDIQAAIEAGDQTAKRILRRLAQEEVAP